MILCSQSLPLPVFGGVLDLIKTSNKVVLPSLYIVYSVFKSYLGNNPLRPDTLSLLSLLALLFTRL
jgi:hypothetical protein